MKYCTNCGNQLNGEKFCPKCGKTTNAAFYSSTKTSEKKSVNYFSVWAFWLGRLLLICIGIIYAFTGIKGWHNFIAEAQAYGIALHIIYLTVSLVPLICGLCAVSVKRGREWISVISSAVCFFVMILIIIISKLNQNSFFEMFDKSIFGVFSKAAAAVVILSAISIFAGILSIKSKDKN